MLSRRLTRFVCLALCFLSAGAAMIGGATPFGMLLAVLAFSLGLAVVGLFRAG